MTMLHDKVVIGVEVCCKPQCGVPLTVVKDAALAWLGSLATVRYTEGPIGPPPGEQTLLDEHVELMTIVDLSDQAKPGQQLLAWDVAWEVGGTQCMLRLGLRASRPPVPSCSAAPCLSLPPQVYVYQLDSEGPVDDDEGEDDTPSYREWTLPSKVRCAAPAAPSPASQHVSRNVLRKQQWSFTASKANQTFLLCLTTGPITSCPAVLQPGRAT